MPIMAATAPAPQSEPLTQEAVDELMADQRAHCAPTTWERFVKSLRANGFPWDTTASL